MLDAQANPRGVGDARAAEDRVLRGNALKHSQTSPGAQALLDRNAWFAAVIRIGKYRLRTAADDLEVTAQAIDMGIVDERGAVCLLEAGGLMGVIDDVLLDMEQPG